MPLDLFVAFCGATVALQYDHELRGFPMTAHGLLQLLDQFDPEIKWSQGFGQHVTGYMFTRYSSTTAQKI